MKLASTLAEGQNYKIYADNYFTCVPLVVKLLERGIHYFGTARQIRLPLPYCNLEDEKSLKKKGRGSLDVQVEENHNICTVKWYDNIAVTLVSSFTSLLYKRDCKALKMTEKEILNRRQFQAQLASSPILVNTHNTAPKRGRPSSGKMNTFTQTVTSGSPLGPQKRPSSTDVSPPAKRSSDHKDMIGHFPEKAKRGRCRHCNMDTQTHCVASAMFTCALQMKITVLGPVTAS